MYLWWIKSWDVVANECRGDLEQSRKYWGFFGPTHIPLYKRASVTCILSCCYFRLYVVFWLTSLLILLPYVRFQIIREKQIIFFISYQFQYFFCMWKWSCWHNYQLKLTVLFLVMVFVDPIHILTCFD